MRDVIEDETEDHHQFRTGLWIDSFNPRATIQENFDLDTRLTLVPAWFSIQHRVRMYTIKMMIERRTIGLAPCGIAEIRDSLDSDNAMNIGAALSDFQYDQTNFLTSNPV